MQTAIGSNLTFMAYISSNSNHYNLIYLRGLGILNHTIFKNGNAAHKTVSPMGSEATFPLLTLS